jgi:phage gpG-like protein
MSDSEEEMISASKLQAKKSSELLKKQSNEATVNAQERIRLKRIQFEKNRELGIYAKSKLTNIKDVQDLFKIIMSGKISTKKDVDKYIKNNFKSDKSDTTKKIKEAIKDIKSDNVKRDIENLIKDVEKSSKKPKKSSKTLIKAVDLGFDIASQPKYKKPKKSKTLNNAVNLAFDMANQPKQKQYDEVEGIEDIIKEVNKISKASKSEKKKLVKADEMHLKYHPSKMDKAELKMDKDILLEPYKYKNMNIVDQIAESLQNPEFEGIKKKKIIDSYSYDTISKFNKKYPELMLKLFKTEEGVDKILKKKADRLEKNKLSDIKKEARLKKYAEKAKALRQEKKAEKTKHKRDLTPEETKKFTQARNYYMRKSKTSDILPKELNKTDPEALNIVCRELAIKGFNTMSEQLFMNEYE